MAARRGTERKAQMTNHRQHIGYVPPNIGFILRRCFPAIFALFLATPLQAAISYVATTGSDNRSCGAAQTISTPKRTIGNAITCLSAGDTLFIRGGTYEESLELFGWPGGTQGTSWETAITISAYQSEPVAIRPAANTDFVMVMRGSGSRATDAPRYLIFNGLTFDGTRGTNYEIIKITAWDPTTDPADAPAHHIRISNSHIVGVVGASGPGPGSASGIIITWDSEYCEILNSEIDHVGRISALGLGPSGQCIYGAASHLLIDGVSCHHAAGYGFSNINSYDGLETVDHIIRNSTVHDVGLLAPNQGGGINEGEGSGHQIYNNVVYNNPSRGIILAFNPGPGGSGTEIYNNTIYNNGEEGIYVSGAQSGTIIRNNVSHANQGGNYTNLGSGTVEDHNSMNGSDPEFIDAEAGDFRLQPTSPLIDVAERLWVVSTDAGGTARPQGAGYDIGAYERPQGAASQAITPTNLRIISQ